MTAFELITLLTEYCSVELFGGSFVGAICHDVGWTSREHHPAVLYFISHLLVAQANGYTVEPRLTTTPLIRPLFFSSNKS